MPYDLMLFPDTYEQTVGPTGTPVFKATGFVLGLDSRDRVITTSMESKLIATTYLKTLLTRKGSSITSPQEGTIMPDVIKYPAGSPNFESDAIAAVLDAEKQTKTKLSSLNSQLNTNLKKASVVEVDSDTGYISISLLTSDNSTASVMLPGNKI